MIFDIPDYIYDIPNDHELYLEYGNDWGLVKGIMTRVYTRTRLSESQNHHCGKCGRLTNLKGKRTKPTIEHIIPVSRKGTNDWSNLVMLCAKCNNRRGNDYIEEEKYVCEAT